jgi:hypothetical protein
MKRAQPEHRLQVQIVDYLRLRGFWPVHIPNGGKLPGTAAQRARTGWLLKSSGLHAGFPDLLVIGSNARVGFIEVKAEGAYQSPAQRESEQQLGNFGHRYAICRSLEDVEDTLVGWGWVTPLEHGGDKLRPVVIGQAA